MTSFRWLLMVENEHKQTIPAFEKGPYDIGGLCGFLRLDADFIEGHNLLLLGSAGTGKSFVINEIAKSLKKIGKNHVLKNIYNVDTIIVDECSMIIQQVFDSINCVCKIEDQSRDFGGIQIIFCGDFLQLPPVASPSYGDEGKYCFESDNFKKTFPHRVILTEIVRQSEEQFITAINEVYQGLATKMSTISAPHVLWLKVGCPLILLRNLSDKLVNGLQGYVKDILDDGSVHFPTANMTKRIPKFRYIYVSVYSPRLNTDIAVREQYPLKPAFGLTIHKAQGMTLNRAEVDCRDIFRPGQLGVAMSRVTTSAGLRVINYHPRYIIPPPQTVKDFVNEASQPAFPDLTCCRNSHRYLCLYKIHDENIYSTSS
ncbi:uncharacterized protein LOC132744216 [Ruditapes philippinarum]|uniref:uncharacterized protein LOC132744216 n=1 Tax=Ruditapes philippinarum TaxID=129788 RepID=UPI00295B052A|nr:uncharacterized protein LOC132744216 [Ruditapes philippinarum]